MNVFLYYADEPHMKNLVMRYVRPGLLDVSTLLPLLNKYLSMELDDNYILMNSLTPPTERAMALLYTMLPSKGPEAYVLFIKCLKEEKEHLGHQELVKLLPKCKQNLAIDTIILLHVND